MKKKNRWVVVVPVVVLLITTVLTGCQSGSSAPQIEATGEIVILPKIESVGEIVTFGEWRGNPLEWEVLEIQEGKALVITKDIIAIRQYDDLDEYGDHTADDFDWNDVKVTWEDSDIRAWLNKDFIDTVFAEDEIRSILMSDIKNSNNEKFGTDGGNDTQDRIFLLSIEEANKYFKTDDDRIAYFSWTEEDKGDALEIVKENGLDGSNLKYEEERLSKFIAEDALANLWWLRSPGNGSDYAAYVRNDGLVGASGSRVSGSIVGSSGGVRPALWISL
jgi:hypothetical protein